MPDHLYRGYRIETASMDEKGVWRCYATIYKNDTGKPCKMVSDAHTYLLKEEADMRALRLAKEWLDKQAGR